MQILTTEQLYDRLKPVKIGATCEYTVQRCAGFVETINEINRLKKEKNAVILAHSYVAPEIIYGVADFVGDSYGLSLDAKRTSADTIIFAAVRFMAETAKILNPTKEVRVPSTPNGCSLADSITAADVRRLRRKFPHHAFVCYINTTAEVKAECDCCVTSSNVYNIIDHYPNDKIFFLPDNLMGRNVIEEMKRRGVAKDIQLYDGVCYVHEDYDPEMIGMIRRRFRHAKILAHPECHPEVAQQADFVGSTSQMIDYVKKSAHTEFMMLTECGLTGRLEAEVPGKKFVGACTLCRYMKANTLSDILRVLKAPTPADRITIPTEIADRALRCMNEMFTHTASKSRLFFGSKYPIASLITF